MKNVSENNENKLLTKYTDIIGYNLHVQITMVPSKRYHPLRWFVRLDFLYRRYYSNNEKLFNLVVHVVMNVAGTAENILNLHWRLRTDRW